MAGEENLGKLLATMEPALRGGDYVFATIEGHAVPSGLDPIGIFREDEGLTLILRADEAAQHGLTARASGVKRESDGIPSGLIM